MAEQTPTQELESALTTLDTDIAQRLEHAGPSEEKDAFLLAGTAVNDRLLMKQYVQEHAQALAQKLPTDPKPLLAPPIHHTPTAEFLMEDLQPSMNIVDAGLKVARLASQKCLEHIAANDPVFQELATRRATLLDRLYPNRTKS